MQRASPIKATSRVPSAELPARRRRLSAPSFTARREPSLFSRPYNTTASVRLKTGMPLRTALAAIALVAFAPSLEPVQSPELDTTTIVHLTRSRPEKNCPIKPWSSKAISLFPWGAQTAGGYRYVQAGDKQEVRHNSSRPYSPGRERFSCFFSLKTKNLKPSGRKA